MCKNENMTIAFLKKSILGQKVNISNSEEVIKKCISFLKTGRMT